MVYSKPITLLQIGGLVLVFGALFYKSAQGVMATKEKEKLVADGQKV